MYRVHRVITYFFVHLTFCSFCISLINSSSTISVYSPSILVICVVLIFVSFSDVVKLEINDGSIDVLLTCFSPTAIVLSKYISFVIHSISGLFFNAIISSILFNFDFNKFILVFFLEILIALIASSLSILISIIQSYFSSNTSFITAFIMPILLPNIVICGMIFNFDENFGLIKIAIGVNIITIPIALYCSSYLLRNIHTA